MKGKIVIITGATSGIGAAAARQFTQAGAIVIPAARRAEPPCDITRDADVQALVARTLDQHGRIDILINNAGLGMRALVETVVPADAHQILETNFHAAVRCIQAVLPVMRRQRAGQIVNISSIVGIIPSPRNAIYCASKFALRSLSESLRVELAPAGIEVISILPGYTDTKFFENMIRYGTPPKLFPCRGQSPDHVAKAIYRACERHRREVTLSLGGHVGIAAYRLAPRFVQWCLRRKV